MTAARFAPGRIYDVDDGVVVVGGETFWTSAKARNELGIKRGSWKGWRVVAPNLNRAVRFLRLRLRLKLPHGDKVDRVFVYSERDCRDLANAAENAPIDTPTEWPFLRPRECNAQCGIAKQTATRAIADGHAAFGIDAESGSYRKPETRIEFRRGLNGCVIETLVISRADAMRIADWVDGDGNLLGSEEMTVAQVAREAGLSLSTVESQIRAGKLNTQPGTCERHRRGCRVVLRSVFGEWKRKRSGDGEPPTITQWAERSSVSAEEIKRAIDRGELRCTGPRRPARRITADEFRRWLPDREAQPAEVAPATHIPVSHAIDELGRRSIGGSDAARRSHLSKGGWPGIPRTFSIQNYRATDRGLRPRTQLLQHMPREFLDWIVAVERAWWDVNDLAGDVGIPPGTIKGWCNGDRCRLLNRTFADHEARKFPTTKPGPPGWKIHVAVAHEILRAVANKSAGVKRRRLLGLAAHAKRCNDEFADLAAQVLGDSTAEIPQPIGTDRVKLFAENEPPFVDGEEMPFLTHAEYCVVLALINAQEAGVKLTKNLLAFRSGIEGARVAFDNLRKKNAKWNEVLVPSGTKREGYRIL